MYSSNGLSSGFGLLIAIAVAGGSLLRVGKIAILFAAIATLSVLGHELYLQFFKFYYSVLITLMQGSWVLHFLLLLLSEIY